MQHPFAFGFLASALLASSTAIAEQAPAAGAAAAETKPAAEQSRYGKQKVVYHINADDPKAQTAGMANIQNHISAVGAENLELRVVMHGDGLSLLLYPDALASTKMKAANATDEMQARITNLKQQGVHFDICANTLKNRQVKLEDLYDASEADLVPSGVAELSRLQAMGYTYVKP